MFMGLTLSVKTYRSASHPFIQMGQVPESRPLLLLPVLTLQIRLSFTACLHVYITPRIRQHGSDLTYRLRHTVWRRRLKRDAVTLAEI